MSENVSERKAVLITALISIPAAILIAMIVHHFLPVPSESVFSFTAVNPVQKAPAPEFPKAPAFSRTPAAAQNQPADLTTLYRKRAEISGKIYKEMEKNFQKGAVSIVELLPFKVEWLMAEGDLFRYQNKVRRFGNSVSDLAVKYEAAKKIAEYQNLALKSGAINITVQLSDEMNMVNAELQLKNNRTFQNTDWQDKYKEYQKNPDLKSYLAMLEAERSIQPQRRF